MQLREHTGSTGRLIKLSAPNDRHALRAAEVHLLDSTRPRRSALEPGLRAHVAHRPPSWAAVRAELPGGAAVAVDRRAFAGAGCRCITSSSSPGISLMQEGISYLAASELPCVIVNIMRGGPGLGNRPGWHAGDKHCDQRDMKAKQ